MTSLQLTVKFLLYSAMTTRPCFLTSMTSYNTGWICAPCVTCEGFVLSSGSLRITTSRPCQSTPSEDSSPWLICEYCVELLGYKTLLPNVGLHIGLSDVAKIYPIKKLQKVDSLFSIYIQQAVFFSFFSQISLKQQPAAAAKRSLQASRHSHRFVSVPSPK